MLNDNDFTIASAEDTSALVLEELSPHPQPSEYANENSPVRILRKPQAIAKIFTALKY
ncbi:MAG: hypothetical protein RMZ69_18200 [Nostoc sp. ChiQUE01a]|nr:hypothetical protein [Nostoc sp. ChiQUE01a]